MSFPFEYRESHRKYKLRAYNDCIEEIFDMKRNVLSSLFVFNTTLNINSFKGCFFVMLILIIWNQI